MKRLIIGTAVLLTLLALGLTVSIAMVRIHAPIAADLRSASEAVLADNWTDAQALADRARSRWQTYREFTAAFADHSPMDELDSLLAQLGTYEVLENKTAFSAACAQLAQLAEAMADSHRLRWWTLL